MGARPAWQHARPPSWAVEHACSCWHAEQGGCLSAHSCSHIQTEKLIIRLVGLELMRRKAAGTYRCAQLAPWLCWPCSLLCLLVAAGHALYRYVCCTCTDLCSICLLCRGKFSALAHFFGYEGRCSLPSNFDATYCNALGQAAGALVASGRTGLMATGA